MPNNTTIGALRVEATLDAGKFVDGARKIRTESKLTETSVKSSFTGIGAALKAGIAGFVGAITVGTFTTLIKQGLDYAQSLQTVSQQMGITTKDLQELQYAAGQSGVHNQDLQTGFERLGNALGRAAAGSKTAIAALGAVGVTLTDINTKSKPEIFGQIADQMLKQGGAAKNAAAGNLIFGESFAKLTPLLDKGSEGINALSDAAETLGIVLSDEQIQRADETANKLDALKTVLTARIAGVVADNADSIYKLADSVAHLVAELPNAINQIRAFYHEVAAASARANAFTSDVLNSVPSSAANMLGTFLPGAQLLQFGYSGRKKNASYQRAEAAEQDWQAFLARTGTGNIPAKSRPATPTTTASDIPQFLARTPRTHSPRTHRAPRDRSEDVTYQFEREQQQADMEILRAKQQLAGSSAERAKLDVQIIQLEHDMQEAEINDRVRKAQRDAAEGKITKSALQQVETQARVLKARNDEETQLKLRAFVEAQLARQEQAQFEANDQRYRFAIDALHAADEAATTQADHRRIQLQILDAEMEQRRLELQHAKDLAIRNGATQEEISNIQAQIDHLAVERSQGAAGIVRNTQGPLEQYFSNLPHTAEEINQAMQSIEVDGIRGLSSALAAAGQGWDAMRNVALQALQDISSKLLQLGIDRALFKLFGNAVLGGAGGGIGSSLYPVANGVDPLAPLPGFASGGSFSVLGRSGVDRNMLSLNGLPMAKVSFGERISIGNDNMPGSRGTSNGRGGGHTFNINVNAPNTGDRARDRATSLQQATDIRRAIGQAAQKDVA